MKIEIKMQTYSEYYYQRLESQKKRLSQVNNFNIDIINNNINNIDYSITRKKRKYEEAMGYPIDSDNEMILLEQQERQKNNKNKDNKNNKNKNLTSLCVV